jgi:large subunit ribosomal protein L21
MIPRAQFEKHEDINEISRNEVYIMYAIVRTGGKQYQVTSGDQLRVEKLNGNVGDTVELNDVLLIAGEGNVTIGQPLVENAKVIATIAEQGRSKKVIVFKKKRRKGFRLKNGHRQAYTALKIQEIMA